MATYKLILRKNKPKKNGTYPIIFKVYLGKKSKIITLPFSCVEKEWDRENKRLRRNRSNYKEVNEKLSKLGIKLQNTIDELELTEDFYDLDDVVGLFKKGDKKNVKRRVTFGEFLEKRINELNFEKRFGYAKTQKATYNSLERFLLGGKDKGDIHKIKSLRFKQITNVFLEDYEHYLRLRGGDDGGIGVRMRDIRTIFNRAIKFNYAEESDYPFNKYKISKLKSSTQKIAISKDEFSKLKSFNLNEDSKYILTFKMFLFSYYAGGMNFKDMTYLKWENLVGGRLVYKRKKTKQKFNLLISKEVNDILNYFRDYIFTENSTYVFPIINKNNLTEKQIEGRYRRCLRKFNKELKEIAKLVGIDKNLTSYVARHSFATHLKFNNVQDNVISQLMGHSSESVTKAYLNEFGNDVLDNAMSKLN